MRIAKFDLINLIAEVIASAKQPQDQKNKPELSFSSFIQELKNVQDGTEKSDVTMDDEDSSVQEKAPKGFEKTVKAMKKHKEIDNPWALSNWMANKGYKSHKK